MHSSRQGSDQTRRRTLGCILLLGGGALLGNGCRVVKETTNVPVNAVESVVPFTKSGQPDPGALQPLVLRFAESFAGQTSVAVDEYASRVKSAEARVEAKRSKS